MKGVRSFVVHTTAPQASMAGGGEVKLLGTWSSPFVVRTRWALEMKGVEYEFIEEDIQNKSVMLLEYNHVHKKVPVLVHNGKPICESFVILEYIEETWKESPLFPKDAHERAMCRFWSKFGDEKCMSAIWQVFTSQGTEHEEAIKRAYEILKYLEQLLEGKMFFGGETINAIDIMLGWIANLVGILEEIVGLSMIDEATFPLLFAWVKRFSDVTVIKKNFPPHDRMLIKYKKIREAIFATGGSPK